MRFGSDLCAHVFYELLIYVLLAVRIVCAGSGMRVDGDLYYRADQPSKSFCDLEHVLVKGKKPLMRGNSAKARV